MVFVKQIIILYFLFVTIAYSADSYYSSISAASGACYAYSNCGSAGNIYSTTCAVSATNPNPPGLSQKFWGGPSTRSNNFYGCYYGNSNGCSGGQSYNINGVCACPSGQVLVNGACQTECPSGQTKQLTASNKDASGQLVIRIGSGPTINDGGCEYECPQGSVDGLTRYGTDSNGVDFIQSTYLCSSTGRATQPTAKPSESQQANAKTIEQPPAPTDSTQPTCQNLPNSSTQVCSGGNIPQGCSTIDGVESCPEKSTVDGETVSPTEEKNCKRSNGQTICLVEPQDADFCGEYNGVTQCYSKTATTSTTTISETTSPDGTKTTTTVTDSSVKGQTGTVETKTVHPDGSITIQMQGKETDDQYQARIAAATEKTVAGVGKVSDQLGEIAKTLKQDQGSAVFNGQLAGAEDSLYSPTTETFQSIFQQFLNTAKTQPLYLAVSEAFVVSFSSCNCPIWETGPISMLGSTLPSIKFDQLCSEFFINTALPFVAGIISILSALIAIKFAFL